jgi:hypothetical protein
MKLDKIQQIVINPYYFSLILISIMLILILLCFDNIIINNFSNFIKFFIYGYIFLCILFLIYNNIFEKDIKAKYNIFKEDHEIVNKMIEEEQKLNNEPINTF